ncbi:unnamed protein product [marine sediment metagenome]|uniref:Uncharacterized protein n=1 Tax=marine sediment metagenome TaxID=412755 RepID=X1RFK7_9ZZZZ
MSAGNDRGFIDHLQDKEGFHKLRGRKRKGHPSNIKRVIELVTCKGCKIVNGEIYIKSNYPVYDEKTDEVYRP